MQNVMFSTQRRLEMPRISTLGFCRRRRQRRRRHFDVERRQRRLEVRALDDATRRVASDRRQPHHDRTRFSYSG